MECSRGRDSGCWLAGVVGGVVTDVATSWS